MLDDRLAAEHDVLRADQGGFPGDLITRIRLDVLSSWRSSRHGGRSVMVVGGWLVGRSAVDIKRAGIKRDSVTLTLPVWSIFSPTSNLNPT